MRCAASIGQLPFAGFADSRFFAIQTSANGQTLTVAR